MGTLPRPQRPGRFTAAVADALEACGRRNVADELDRHPSVLSRWADEGENGSSIPGAMLDQLCRRFPDQAAPVFARHFARLAGGSFLPTPRGASDLGAAGARLSRETADACGRLMEALGEGSRQPGDLTPEEAEEVAREAQEVVEAAAALAAAARARLPQPGPRAVRSEDAA